MQIIRSIMQACELVFPVNPARYVTRAEAPAKSQRPEAEAYDHDIQKHIQEHIQKQSTEIRRHTAATGV